MIRWVIAIRSDVAPLTYVRMPESDKEALQQLRIVQRVYPNACIVAYVPFWAREDE